MRTEQIPGYRVERLLGSGAFATVWLATDEMLDGAVAIKVLADNWARDPDIRSRFIEEAKILWHLDDDRVVRVHRVDVLADDRPYFVMSWADRASLHDRLVQLRREGKHVDIDTALLLGVELATCLQVVHQSGVVHRDVKPSNILFRSRARHRMAGETPLGDEQMMLADFGLAKQLAQGSGFTLAAGTPAYMPPEQARPGSALDHRADLFAATAVLFELLTGRAPFSAETLGDVARGGRSATSPRLRELRGGLPSALQDIIDTGLQPRPEDRFSSALELRLALQALMGGRPEVPPPAAPASATPVPSAGRTASLEGKRAIGDIIDVVRTRFDDSEHRRLLFEAEARLHGHFRVAVIGSAPETSIVAAALGDDGSEAERFDVISSSDSAIARAADAVIVALPPLDDASEALQSLRRDLLVAAPGPVVAAGVVLTGGEGAPGTDRCGDWAGSSSTRQMLGALVTLEADSVERAARVRALLDLLRERGTEVRSSAALALLQSAVRFDGSDMQPMDRQLRDRLEALELVMPGLDQIRVLRDDVSGRLALPQTLRDDLRRVLGAGDIDRRLGLLAGSSPEERGAAARRGAERWRSLVNTGRIAFASRGAANVVERAYEHLWSLSEG